MVKTKTTHNLAAAALVTDPPVLAKATIRTRMNFGVQQFRATRYFANLVMQREREHQGEPLGPFFEEIVWLSMSTLLNAVAGLESYINEFFVDREHTIPELPEPAGSRLWDLAEAKQTTLEKYGLALELLGREPFAKGSEPYQSVDALIRLRNAVQHFKPEWFDDQDAHAKLSDRLQNFFDGSPFLTGSESLFPRRWMSASFAEWAASRVVEFAVEFDSRTGVERLKHLDGLKASPPNQQ